MDFDPLHHFSNFSASCDAIFKITDATCMEIDAFSIFGALIEQKFAATPREYRGNIFPHSHGIQDPDPESGPRVDGDWVERWARVERDQSVDAKNPERVTQHIH